MKSKIENLNTENKCNSFYFKCTNCGKIIPPVGGYFKSSDRNLVCDCGCPDIEDTIFIDIPKNVWET